MMESSILAEIGEANLVDAAEGHSTSNHKNQADLETIIFELDSLKIEIESTLDSVKDEFSKVLRNLF